MRRSDLRHRMQQQPALARYLATRQLLQTPTMKPMRFLQTLGLITPHSHFRDRGVRSLRSTRVEPGVNAAELGGEDLAVAELMERTEETKTETKSPFPLSANRFTPKPLPQ